MSRALGKKVSGAYIDSVATRRTYHHGNLKRGLIETSINIVESDGLDALSVAEAGRRLGVSSAAPYRHFKDRGALLRAVAEEGNLRLTHVIVAEVGDEPDPQKAFAKSGVAYVAWAAEHPELYRVIFDSHHIDFAQEPPKEIEGVPPEALQQMATFWPDLAQLVKSGEELSPEHPTLQELSGRALAHGLASMFVTGVFASLGIGSDRARAIAQATMGLGTS